MQYNISDSQDLCCFVLIILRMASLKTCSNILWDSKPDFVLILVSTFFGQNQRFCSYKIVLIKNREKSMAVMYKLSSGVVLIFFSLVNMKRLRKLGT